jgi:shikimate dehydrogenase
MTVSGKARVAGIIGWPVAHSLSMRLHGFWLRQFDIDGLYAPFPVRPGSLEQALRALPLLGIAGVNLTVPHKVEAMAVLDRVDDLTRRIGAANTIIVAEDGALEGRNTDGYGFIESLRAGAPGWSASGGLEAGPAVVLGAGGAARAVIVALLDAGAPNIRLANRTLSTAQGLADELGPNIEAVPWDQRGAVLGDAALLVNTTSLGLTGHKPLEIALDDLPQSALVTDVVYAPLMTGLLTAAAARGNKTVDGLGMLLHQGRPGFKAWFGREPEVTQELRDHVLLVAG